MTLTAEIEHLAESIASLVLSRTVPQPTFWDYADIAHNLRASKSTVARWVSMPDFPRPIRPPTAGRGIGHPLHGLRHSVSDEMSKTTIVSVVTSLVVAGYVGILRPVWIKIPGAAPKGHAMLHAADGFYLAHSGV